MPGEDRANRLYHLRENGWYVVNRDTNRAVAGPLPSVEVAQDEKQQRDCKWTSGPDPLVVLAVQRA